MIRIMQNSLVGNLEGCLLAELTTRVWIAIMMREIRDGDLNPDAVARPEQVRRWPEVDRVLVDVARLERRPLLKRLP
jgi:hypothetical protein